jgi:hypothetical protein
MQLPSICATQGSVNLTRGSIKIICHLYFEVPTGQRDTIFL